MTKTKFVQLICAVVLCLSLVASLSCAKPAPTPTPTRAPTPSAAPAPAPKPTPAPAIKLKFTTFNPNTHHYARSYRLWADEVQKRTNGRVTVEIYYDSTLASAQNTLEALRTGLADGGWLSVSYAAGRFPLTEALGLPLLFRNSEEIHRVMWRLSAKYLNKENLANGVIYSFGGAASPQDFWFAKKEVKVMEDLAGLKIRTPGGLMGDAVNALGAVSTSVSPTECYLALDRGVINGITWAAASIPPYKLEEVIKYALKVGLGTSATAVYMSAKTWDSLPNDVREAIQGANQVAHELASTSYDVEDKAVLAKIEAAGVKINNITDKEKVRWVEKVQPLRARWIGEMEAKGLPAKEFLAAVEAVLQEKR